MDSKKEKTLMQESSDLRPYSAITVQLEQQNSLDIHIFRYGEVAAATACATYNSCHFFSGSWISFVNFCLKFC